MSVTNTTPFLDFKNTKKGQKPQLIILGQQIKNKDIPYIVLCASALIYFTIRDPLVVASLGVVAIPLISFWQITQAIPFFSKRGLKIEFWQITSIIIAIVSIFSIFDTPAQAFFLSGLEDFFNDLVAGAQTGTGSTLNTTAVALFFNFLRAIFLIGVVIAALFAYGQAQQGNDWRPIGTQIALAFGIVIAIDLITYIFTGS